MGSKALVLGGGGPVGIAWESGLLAGLAQAGVDLGEADFTLGTSAGSFVGARLALGAETAKLADPILADAESPVQSKDRGGRPPADLSQLMRLMSAAQTAKPDDAAGARAELGAYALAAETMDEDAFIRTFGRSFASLPDDEWPERGFACTAVDTGTGAFQLWTKDSGVGVTRAVASSCSVPGVYPPISLKGRRWMDGGARSATNADLAAGHDLVVVISVRPRDVTAGASLVRMFASLDEEVAKLEAHGARVVVISPDARSQEAMGPNLMDFRRRAGAARAGLAQGAAAAAALAEAWT
jgi:NTE family protein